MTDLQGLLEDTEELIEQVDAIHEGLVKEYGPMDAKSLALSKVIEGWNDFIEAVEEELA